MNSDSVISFQDNSLVVREMPGVSFVSPLEPFSVFDGESTNGLWTLSFEDSVFGSEGILYAWSLHCGGSLFLSPLTIHKFPINLILVL